MQKLCESVREVPTVARDSESNNLSKAVPYLSKLPIAAGMNN